MVKSKDPPDGTVERTLLLHALELLGSLIDAEDQTTLSERQYARSQAAA